MDEKSKLFVFAKKEIALLFFLMVLIAFTSFVLGIKIGKNHSFLEAGYTEQDRQELDLLSPEEEKAQELSGDNLEAPKLEETHQQLKEEFEKLDQEQVNPKAAPPQVEDVQITQKAPEEIVAPPKTAMEKAWQAERQKFAGKFTIQLGSHRDLEEAKKFAEGFKVRGYRPIVNEVYIEGKGTWYRVSIGVFDSKKVARDYIKSEETLFEGHEDYYIVKIN